VADPSAIEAAVPGDGGLSRPHRRMIAALSATQTVGYGVLYYSFSVFLAPIAATLHTTVTAVAGALTVSVIVTGVAGIPIGRWIDQHGGKHLMVCGSVLGAAAVAAWSQVHNTTGLYLVFAAIGLSSAMVLYEPAFAVVIQTVPEHHRTRAILAVTIVAGFASSIFIPLTGLLNAYLGWRHALLVLAAAYLAVAVPLHALSLPAVQRRHTPRRTPAATTGSLQRALTDRAFWLLLTAFASQGAAVAVIGVLLVTYLVRLGHTPLFAATVAGLLGILSVTGRLLTTSLRRHLSLTAITAIVFALQAAGAATLPWTGPTTLGAVISVTAIGLGFGVATIARPAVLADRYPINAYGRISGAMATPMNLAKATAPLVAAALATHTGGYTTVMMATAAAFLTAATAIAIASGVPSWQSSGDQRAGAPTSPLLSERPTPAAGAALQVK